MRRDVHADAGYLRAARRLDGLWTTDLADHYLPMLDLPEARYECIDGRLVVSPTGVGSNSYGAIEPRLLKLVDGKYEPLAGAAGGQEFVASDPFEIRFTPRDLAP